MSKYEFDFVLKGQSIKIAEIMAALDELLDAEGVTSFEQDAIKHVRNLLLQANGYIGLLHRE